jgi:hypothetical protein
MGLTTEGGGNRRSLGGDAGEVLDELRGRRLIERLDAGAFFISKWREKDDPGLRDQ